MKNICYCTIFQFLEHCERAPVVKRPDNLHPEKGVFEQRPRKDLENQQQQKTFGKRPPAVVKRPDNLRVNSSQKISKKAAESPQRRNCFLRRFQKP